MDDDPRKLAEFVHLSGATKVVLWQNISLALGIKVVFLALAMAGQATLWMAVFADMGANLLVVFNGFRLLRPPNSVLGPWAVTAIAIWALFSIASFGLDGQLLGFLIDDRGRMSLARLQLVPGRY